MSLHEDLLEQAEHLVARDPLKPKQANLRRAISSAYYALFHLLVDEASKLVASGVDLDALRPRVARAFAHKEMKSVSRAVMFAGDSPKVPGEIAGMRTTPPPRDLISVAVAFVRLQEARHEADYDLGRRFTRQEATDYASLARDAFEAWSRVRTNRLAKTYLFALLLWNKWEPK